MDANDESSSSTDPLFRTENPIFKQKELLEIDLVPDEDRIVGRDEEIQNVANALNPAILGQSPRNIIIYGKTGTGKSLVARHVTGRAKDAATTQETALAVAYIDCAQANTETRAIFSLAEQLHRDSEMSVSIPSSGIATDEYYTRFWHIIDSLYDVVILILDEIDKLDNDDILMQLSRANEAGKVNECRIGIIAVSNKISYRDVLNERVKSSLQERELVFPPYDADQLCEIMAHRADAFKSGVLENDTIPLAAAFAASEHGDARKAFDILRNAGEIAVEEDDATVGESHVRKARSRADVNRFSDLVRNQPQQVKVILLSLAFLVSSRDDPKIPSSDIYQQYCDFAAIVDVSQLSQRRVYDLLQEQAFLDILGQEFEGRGRARGSVMKFFLLEDAETVVQAITEQTDRFEDRKSVV